MKTKTSILLAIALFGLFLSLALLVTSHHDPRPTKEEQTAMSVLPGYLVVFDGETNTILHSDNVQTFRNQHPMMDYLTVLAPYVKQYDHPKNHPIMIQETGDHIILELPSRVRFPPYNWKIYWGSPYYLKMEIDKTNRGCRSRMNRTHEGIAVKTRNRILLISVAAGMLLLMASSLSVIVAAKRPVLSEQERFAMEALPGYFFVFEGKTNHIVRAKSHDAFLDQHPMMPYLELVRGLTKSLPFGAGRWYA